MVFASHRVANAGYGQKARHSILSGRADVRFRRLDSRLRQSGSRSQIFARYFREQKQSISWEPALTIPLAIPPPQCSNCGLSSFRCTTTHENLAQVNPKHLNELSPLCTRQSLHPRMSQLPLRPVPQLLTGRFPAYRGAGSLQILLRDSEDRPHSDGFGTGFFINATGTVVTAAHVVFVKGAKMISTPTGLLLQTSVSPRSRVEVETATGIKVKMNLKADLENSTRALSDLAVFDSGIATPCFLRMASVQLPVGAETYTSHRLSSGLAWQGDNQRNSFSERNS